ncbi:MAG: hypothetical protein WCG45_01215 [bacterium]
MKKHKIKDEEDTFLVSSNNCDDDQCPICLLMKECEEDDREPTFEEVEWAMKVSEF